MEGGSSSKKTTVKKKTNSPEWDESLSLHVTDSSVLLFRVYSRAKLFDDPLLAQAQMKISAIPKLDNGECEFMRIILFVFQYNAYFQEHTMNFSIETFVLSILMYTLIYCVPDNPTAISIQLNGKENNKVGTLKVAFSSSLDRSRRSVGESSLPFRNCFRLKYFLPCVELSVAAHSRACRNAAPKAPPFHRRMTHC